MFSSEIKETVYIAISCILVAMVLGLVAFVLNIRSDLAAVTNMEIATQQNMATYNKLNKYEGQLLYGEDVIACIREFANSNIAIYVGDLTGESSAIKDYYLDEKKYIDCNGVIATIDFLEYGKGTGVPAGYTLTGGVKRDITYYAYLVFGEYLEEDIKNAKARKSTKDDKSVSYSDVTAIKILKVSDLGRCDEEGYYIDYNTDDKEKKRDSGVPHLIKDIENGTYYKGK